MKLRVVRESGLLMSMVECDVEELGEEYVDDMLKEFNLFLVYKMYGGYFKFTDEEFLELIEVLSYLDNCMLEDIILLAKYRKCGSEVLNPDLFKIYNNLDIEEDIFLTFVQRGSFEISKFLLGPSKKYDKGRAFLIACEYGHLEIAKWLFSLIKGTKLYKINGFKSSTNNYKGNLEVLKWLYSLGKIDTKTENDAFLSLCYSGNLEACMWLYDFGNINCFSDILRFLNRYKNKENSTKIIRWLYSLGRINIDTYHFKSFCGYGYLELAKYFYLILDIDEHTYNSSLYYACQNEQLDVIEWLFTVSSFDRENKNIAFKIASRNDKLLSMKLLYNYGEIDPNFFR